MNPNPNLSLNLRLQVDNPAVCSRTFDTQLRTRPNRGYNNIVDSKMDEEGEHWKMSLFRIVREKS